jgi:RTX calcium-binding nonapeptide repeat (4 copies)
MIVAVTALFLPAAPAAADSPRLEMVTEDGATGARLVYTGDGRSNKVTIGLARNEDLPGPELPDPERVIGFLVQGASLGAGCEAVGYESAQVCRVPEGTRLLAPRFYGRAGNDTVWIEVPRSDAIVYGGPGNDQLNGPFSADEYTSLPSELYGGPGDDSLAGSGLLFGGPGNDFIGVEEEARVASRIVAGTGRDQIEGSDRAEVINAGPGRDEVLAWDGNDVIRAQDGETDRVDCSFGRDLLIGDGRDESVFLDPPFPGECERLKRRGEPLLVPFEFQNPWENESYVGVVYGCPGDGPSLCTGTVALRRDGRLIGRRPLRERAGNLGFVDFPFGERRIRRLLGEDIRITIRWRDRAGHMRSLTRTDSITVPPEPDDP